MYSTGGPDKNLHKNFCKRYKFDDICENNANIVTKNLEPCIIAK